jgi:hypothetical protein
MTWIYKSGMKENQNRMLNSSRIMESSKKFRESLLRSLLLGILLKKLKPDPRQQSANHSKYKLADHKLEEKGVPAHIVWRRCANFYERSREQ